MDKKQEASDSGNTASSRPRFRLPRSDLGIPKLRDVVVDNGIISYDHQDGEGVGVYMAGYPLTPDTCYFEAQVVGIGLYGTVSIGICSRRHPLDLHIGYDTDSVAMMTNGWLWSQSRRINRYIPCRHGDTIGCGIYFEDLAEKKGEPFCTLVPVYFVKNGVKLQTTVITLPFGGLYPAVGLASPGDAVKLSLDLNWVPQEDDTYMSVDNNDDEWYRLNDIRLNGQVLEYTGRGKSIVDVGLAQARSPLTTTHHYFEIEIVDPGESCYIAIGLTRRDYPKHRHPGWNKGSIGYHADDGKIFIGSGVGDPFGPRCHKGDRMGCGILFPTDYVCHYDSDGGSIEMSPSSPTDVDELLELLDTSESEDEEWWNNHCGVDSDSKVKVFFTRNSKTIGARQVRIPKGGFYPTIGMLSVEEKVRVDLRPLTG